jgi:RHS repeat-associated protein
MPRTARAIEAGMIYHVLNRGNGRMRISFNAGDYEAFERGQLSTDVTDPYNPIYTATYTNYYSEGVNDPQVVDWSVEYAYDYQNRLIYKNFYDPDGNQGNPLQRQTAFAYDGNQIALQFDREGSDPLTPSNLSHRYLWGPAVDQILADENVDDGGPEDVLWTLTDHLNTVRDLAVYTLGEFPGTGTTAVVTHRVFDAFGRMTDEIDPTTGDPAEMISLFGFTGKPFDRDTELQNNINRWYEASTGKWLSEDPIGFNVGDVNLYRYVVNSSSSNTDPLGLQIDAPCGTMIDPSEQFSIPLSLNQVKPVEIPDPSKIDEDDFNPIVDWENPEGVETTGAVYYFPKPQYGKAKITCTSQKEHKPNCVHHKEE